MITASIIAEDIITKFAFYLQSGITVYALSDGYDKFYIAEDLETASELSRYHYPGDDIQYSLDALCVNLYDAFQDAIFPSQDEFYADLSVILPQINSPAVLRNETASWKYSGAAAWTYSEEDVDLVESWEDELYSL